MNINQEKVEDIALEFLNCLYNGELSNEKAIEICNNFKIEYPSSELICIHEYLIENEFIQGEINRGDLNVICPSNYKITNQGRIRIFPDVYGLAHEILLTCLRQNNNMLIGGKICEELCMNISCNIVDIQQAYNFLVDDNFVNPNTFEHKYIRLTDSGKIYAKSQFTAFK
ncbi:hypothetical protein [Entomomonas asaccharolytica]|uniref:Uncharacterized protein n=1 Tax=Entomomonas asaccharolytica TaxID=2785331 RepID=A0A974NEC6_9GAMM|nr:hypothetical protein [Entomomonas asaccharolytica]QQP85081.1 hypothetical protein JHT90_11895 [Entomomonas asaccharolytica]